jgi:acetyl-CoA carboxylase biotin carboxyl carrier protein
MDKEKLAKIKELIDFAKGENLKSFSVETEDFAISFEFITSDSTLSTATKSETQKDTLKSSGNATYVDSPLDGKFYRSPSPDADPYVENGSKISENETVCIVEAMKVMNEITAEAPGRIVKILCENGDDVRVGQHLFQVEPV